MIEEFTLKLDNPITEEQWDTIIDVDFEHTDRIWFHTKHGYDVEFVKQKWIPVSERLPEEHTSIFAKLKGTDKWRSAMFEKSSDDVRIVEEFEDGTRRVFHSYTLDGKWRIEMEPPKRTVTHWMPNPDLPKK